MLTITPAQSAASRFASTDPALRASLQSGSLEPFLDTLAESSQRLRAQRDAADRDDPRDDDADDPAQSTTTDHAAAAFQDERDMKPGSRAARDAQQARDLRSDVAERRIQDRATLEKAAQAGSSASLANAPAQRHDAPRSDASNAPSNARFDELASDSASRRAPNPAAQPSTPFLHSSPSELTGAENARIGNAPSSSPVIVANGAAPAAPELPHAPSHPASALPAFGASAQPSPRPASSPQLAAPNTPEVASTQSRDAAPPLRSSSDAQDVSALTARRTPAATETSKPAQTAETAETRNSDANIERFLRVLRNRLGRDGGNLTVRLDPPSLGKLRVHMDIQRDALTLTVDADTLLARRLLSDQSDALRQVVEAAGLRLDRFEVRLADLDHAPSRRESDGSNDAPRHDDPRDAPGFDERSADRRHDDARQGENVALRQHAADSDDARRVETEFDDERLALELDGALDPINASLKPARARSRPASISLWA